MDEGRSHVRVDGKAKVTGTASYAADFVLQNVSHAAVITSTIARGRIAGFDLSKAKRVPGVLTILTYQDLAGGIHPVKHLMAGGFANSSALPLGSSEIYYAGQIVALVVAESRESAEEAAAAVGVRYESEKPEAVLGEPGENAVPFAAVRPTHKDPKLGDAPAAFAAAPVQVDETYRTPIQHHNPIELFGTTCVWDGDKLIVYEASRYLDGVQHGLAAQLGIDPAQIRVLCPFMGGHFGSRLALSQYTAPVAIAAKRLGRPVRYVATRAQCFTVQNHRPDTQHHIRIGASEKGEFTAFIHETDVTSSRFDDFLMEGTDVTAGLYAWRNVETKESLVRVDRNTPGPMRAPPEVPYLFALESAVDEAAERLGIDPVELRRRNDTTVNPVNGKPFVPRLLMECFDAGAKAFRWEDRNGKAARSMRDGDWRVGYGCASSVRPVKRGAAIVRVAIDANGRATVATAHHEIGNGIYTVLAMETSERLRIPVDAVTVRLGDTALPPAGISGGSSTTTSLVPALAKACKTLEEELARAAIAQSDAFAGMRPEQIRFSPGGLLASDTGTKVKIADLLSRMGKTRLETTADAAPPGGGADAVAKLREGKLTLGGTVNSLRWGFGAQFVEVRVHSLTGEIRVPRMTGAFSAGYIINPLTAISQLRGGMISGLGSALLEASEMDLRSARYVNDDLANYLVATAADIGTVEAILLNADANPDPSDLMGLGELGIIGVNAAIANALFHATGRRFRSLPVRIEETLASV
jgi:xanthine dehydrogenase YagR molybdenum-binding subunit